MNAVTAGGGPKRVPVRYVRRVRRRRSRLRRAFLVFLLVLGVLAAAVFAGGLLVVNRLNGAVVPGNLLGTARAPRGVKHGPLNYLLIGSNWRNDNPGNGERADSIMIVHIPRGAKSGYLVSVPRDLYYTIKPYSPTGFEGSTEKIDAALNYGGMPLMSQTVADLTGLKFNGAVEARFDGFKKAVKSMGGVNMCVDEKVVSVHIGRDKNGHYAAPYTNLTGTPQPVPGVTPQVYYPGCQHLAAWQALDYVRQRELLPGGDYDRQRHQQQFMMAVLKQTASTHTMSNPIKLDRVVHDIGSSMLTDTNGVSVTNLVLMMRGIKASSLVGLRTPSYPDEVDGTSYVMPDDGTPELWQALRDDTLQEFAKSHPELVNPLNTGGS
ncbi:LCP family protein [Rugosimonospora acidiphila]|uniref:LCP family protein n=1 Tax=Rugosimonospora acidiphila TaxID=556531 RepID=A0ABP9RVE4_9ACTN